MDRKEIAQKHPKKDPMAVTAKFPTNVPTPDANRSDSGIWKYSEGIIK